MIKVVCNLFRPLTQVYGLNNSGGFAIFTAMRCALFLLIAEKSLV
jgi:hypothetical protein